MVTTYTKEQQAENRAKLVAALRSGEYKQGRNYLRVGDEFCCLGVACEVAVKEGVIPPPRGMQGGVYEYELRRGDEDEGLFGWTGCLPPSVRAWLGFRSDGGSLKEPVSHEVYELNSLIALNDDGRYTFDQIADVIEQDKVALQEDTHE